MELDAAAGNNKWAVAHQLEMDQIREYEVFIDKGIYHVSKVLRGFQQIRITFATNVNMMVAINAASLGMGTSPKFLLIASTQELFH